MRVVRKDITSERDLEGDLKLVRLATSATHSEPGEDCYAELSRALDEALEVVQRSLKQ